MRRFGVTGTIKHFACNNQEFKRTEIDSVLSERALREIYLRAFETAVKEGGAYSVMSTYGGLNGIWTASNFDLLTTILRDEWGFIGTVMTDWWAKGNDREGEEATARTSLHRCARRMTSTWLTRTPPRTANTIIWTTPLQTAD